MSFHQYIKGAHIEPNAKSPIALAVEPRYHVVIRVGRGNAIDKGLSGFVHPDNSGVEIFGGISGDGLFEGHRVNSITYDEAKDRLSIFLEGGNPDGWTGLAVTLPGGGNYTCSYDPTSEAFVWPSLGNKNFSFTGVSVAMDMVPVT
jgi:hypothetical protein